MTLFFGSDEKVRCIAHPATKEDLYETINKFLKEKDYKSYYTRTFALTDTVTCYDVGSWTQFFCGRIVSKCYIVDNVCIICKTKGKG